MNRRKLIKSVLCTAAVLPAGVVLWRRRWRYIVIHHSAGNFGTIDFLQEVHRQRQAGDPIAAIPYHYVIGNGNGLAMGEIASDWRKKYAIWGAHVSSNNSRRNFYGIGICLIGNFEINHVPEEQYQSLVLLTKYLMQKYDVPLENVSAHGLTKGESTKCPGRHFPMDRFLQEIKSSAPA